VCVWLNPVVEAEPEMVHLGILFGMLDGYFHMLDFQLDILMGFGVLGNQSGNQVLLYHFDPSIALAN